MQNKEPDRFYIRKSDVEHYKRIKDRDSPLEKRSNKELFFLALSVGYFEGIRIELDNKEGFVRTEYLTDKDISLISALAVIEEESLDVLLDKKKVYSIAEEYAAGGIKQLKEMIFGGGYASFNKLLESELIDEFNKIQLKNK